MKALFVLRQSEGGIWAFANAMADGLRSRDVDVDVQDLSHLIPSETGPKVDEKVSADLRTIGSHFDLVHAWGYRSAWACSCAFGDDEAWFYTAHDMPKTTHRLLINHLNRSQGGFCSSRAVFRVLDEALAFGIEIVHPATTMPPPESESPTDLRDEWSIPHDSTVVGSIGRFVDERGFESFVRAASDAMAHRPAMYAVLAGQGPLKGELAKSIDETGLGDRFRILDWQSEPRKFYRAIDLLAVPSHRAGFSMAAIESMSEGTPVLLRDTGGLREIVDIDVSGFLFQNDDEFASVLGELVDLPLTLESVGRGAKIRALDFFSIDRPADRVLDAYQRVFEP